jgi:hypothetical protein
MACKPASWKSSSILPAWPSRYWATTSPILPRLVPGGMQMSCSSNEGLEYSQAHAGLPASARSRAGELGAPGPILCPAGVLLHRKDSEGQQGEHEKKNRSYAAPLQCVGCLGRRSVLRWERPAISRRRSFGCCSRANRAIHRCSIRRCRSKGMLGCSFIAAS